ncbi:MAG: hypothetical protein JWN25_7 [Verrucomicrobiales bacterium]|nr:hypothetical protein [Verrucomicrobiales bacterium]
MNSVRLLLLASLLLVMGCDQKPTVAVGSAPPTNSAAPAEPAIPTAAQPTLRKITLYIGTHEMEAEMALSGREMQTGMMFRTNMNTNDGMLFVFPRPTPMSFWMKNTSIKLNAAYIDPEGVIAEIHNLEPFDTNSVFSATDNLQYVLETPQGWFEKNGVGTGTVIRTRYGTLKQTFFRQK